MATNVRSIQQKLFRTDSHGPPDISDPPKPDNPLTISIPKPATPPSTIPPKAAKPTPEAKGSPAQNEQAPQSYRDRLRQRLGTAYKTVEQYRLDQDDKRERHWKRWGPYVSDRQWVWFTSIPAKTFALTSSLGYSQGRLFGGRRRMGTFPPRARSLADLQMGRRRYRRYQRQPPASLLLPCSVERE